MSQLQVAASAYKLALTHLAVLFCNAYFFTSVIAGN